MAHFVVAYVHSPDLVPKEAAVQIVKRLRSAEWDGKLTIRVREKNPWIQVEGFWPNEIKDIGRVLSADGLTVVVVEEETVSGYTAYSRFRDGKFVFYFMRVEDTREIKGKPLRWEQDLFHREGDEAVYSLSPIARHLQLPGFEGEQTGYWSIELPYKP